MSSNPSPVSKLLALSLFSNLRQLSCVWAALRLSMTHSDFKIPPFWFITTVYGGLRSSHLEVSTNGLHTKKVSFTPVSSVSLGCGEKKIVWAGNV